MKGNNMSQPNLLTVYGDVQSGNCYKVKLVLSFLGIEHEWRHVDILKGDTKQPELLALNPNGKIPVAQWPDQRVLAESNAIIHYLASGSRLIPEDPFAHAQMLSWQFFEQYSHEPYIAVARFIRFYQNMPAERLEEYRNLQPKGYRALDVMERQLAQTPYLCGQSLSLADISLYAYTHVAHQGGFELARYPHIQRWIGQIQKLPGYVGMAD